MQELHLDTFTTPTFKEEFIKGLNLKKQAKYKIFFPSEFSSSKVLRDLIEGISRELDIIPIWRARLVLIADELNNNSIEHGSREGDTNEFCICITKKDAEVHLEIQVSDTGRGGSHKTAKEMESLRQEHQKKDFKKHRSIRGRGLFLIISDLVEQLSFSDTSQGGLNVGVKLQVPTNQKQD